MKDEFLQVNQQAANGPRMSGVPINLKRSERIYREVRSIRLIGGGERQRAVG